MVSTITVVVFLVVVAAFGGVLLTHRNTMKVVEPLDSMDPAANPSTDIDCIREARTRR